MYLLIDRENVKMDAVQIEYLHWESSFFWIKETFLWYTVKKKNIFELKKVFLTRVEKSKALFEPLRHNFEAEDG